MRDRGSIDVLIAARDTSGTIARAVCSVLSEPEVASVAVVDDASRDATADAALAAGGGDPRLTVQRLAANVGPAAARNVALSTGSAPWVAVLDADDYMLPGRFARMLHHRDTADLIADDLLASDGEAPPVPMFRPAVVAPVPLDARTFILGNSRYRTGARRRDLGYIKPLVRRALIGDGFRPDLRLGEDYELYARLLLGGARGVLIPAAGYVYRIDPASLSGCHTADDLCRLRDADRALLPLADRAERRALDRHTRSVDARLQWRLLIAAVKARSFKAAAATFVQSPTVTAFLLEQLAAEAWRRAFPAHKEPR